MHRNLIGECSGQFGTFLSLIFAGKVLAVDRKKLNDRYKALIRKFADALANNRSARELQKIREEIRQVIQQYNGGSPNSTGS